MAHWRSLMDKESKTLGHWNLEQDGKYVSVTVTILKLYAGEIVVQGGKNPKVLAKLKEFDKPMVVNPTNFKRLRDLFKSEQFEDYLNKPVLLQVEKVNSPEGLVDALRFSVRPAPTKEQLKPAITDEAFPNALASVKSGKTTIEKLMSTRSLTEDQIKQLNEIQK
jgi:uncharacterized protein (DUF1330 family)